MNDATRRYPALGPATGDSVLIENVETRARTAGVRDRLSVVLIEGTVRHDAHFGAGPATEYEIGSLTKTMTSLLFAEAVDAGTLRADATVGSFIDLGRSAVADVTLEELAGHRSGLPRIASGARYRLDTLVAVLRHRNPYTADLPDLIEHAKSAKLGCRGSFSYSNLGAALLGQALAAHAGIEYPGLLARDLFARLDMTQSTAPVTTDHLSPNAPTGWSAHGKAERPWTMGSYVPAGGVRSTPDDMARYAQALLDGTAPGLTALTPRWETDGASRVGYAWFTDHIGGVDITWHNGATGGFSCMLALDLAHAAAAIVLANTAVPLDGIAMDLLT